MKHSKDIAKAIYREALNGLDSVDTFVHDSNGVEKEAIKSYLLFEFIFLYIHLVSRDLQLDKSKEEENSALINEVVTTIIDTYIHVKATDYDEHQKSELRKGIFGNLQERENEYGHCVTIMNHDGSLSSKAILPLFAKRVADLTNNDQNLELVLKIISVAGASFFSIRERVNEK